MKAGPKKFKWKWCDWKFQTKHKFNHITSFLVHHHIGMFLRDHENQEMPSIVSLNLTICCQRNCNKSKICFCFIWILQIPSVGSMWMEIIIVYSCIWFCPWHNLHKLSSFYATFLELCIHVLLRFHCFCSWQKYVHCCQVP